MCIEMEKESIAVVGGGILGITAAMELAKTGKYKVTLFEKDNKLGGLSTFYRWNDVICDRFYHVILPTDSYLLEFIDEIGLESQILWRSVKSGFFGKGRLISLSSVQDFVFFPFLSLWQKFQLGLGILYSSRIKKTEKLDNLSANQWLSKVFGKAVFEKVWEPLLRSKFGRATDTISASFMQAVISRLYGTRSKSKKQEKMGHVMGGYYSILKNIHQKLTELNVDLKINTTVKNVNLENGRNIFLKTDTETLRFNKLLLTIPCPEVIKIVNDFPSDKYWQRLKEWEYLGIICVMVILQKKLSPYYVINLLDSKFPFTGIIESTNVISSQDVGGNNIVYLPKYVNQDDPINNFSDEQITVLFIDNLKKIFSNLHGNKVLHTEVFREKYVQPLQKVGYQEQNISINTPQKNVYLVNSTMITDSTLNNNAIIKLARRTVQTISDS